MVGRGTPAIVIVTVCCNQIPASQEGGLLQLRGAAVGLQQDGDAGRNGGACFWRRLGFDGLDDRRSGLRAREGVIVDDGPAVGTNQDAQLEELPMHFRRLARSMGLADASLR
jgi:hypothetical protein